MSSCKKLRQRCIDGMLERLAPGDRLIVSELSRLGRSLGQVIHIVHELVKRKIRFTVGLALPTETPASEPTEAGVILLRSRPYLPVGAGGGGGGGASF